MLFFDYIYIYLSLYVHVYNITSHKVSSQRMCGCITSCADISLIQSERMKNRMREKDSETEKGRESETICGGIMN